jgi:uncharacterized protein YbjT (DUF2867 family)
VPAVTTLVLAGTGKTGRRVLAGLAARGEPVRAGSRSGTPPFDWEDRRTWRAALDGVRAVYVAYSPDLAFPGAAAAIAAFAQASGTRRLVLLSRRGEEGSAEAEQALRACAQEWTIVRSSFLSQTFSEQDFLLRPLLEGDVALPARPVGEPFVDARDVADVAVAALTDARHTGRVYEVSGPRLLTFAEAIEEIAEAAGRPIRYTRIPMDEYAAALAERGTPVVCVSLLKYLFAEVLDGRNARLATGVQQVLGREPCDFADFAQAAAASGAWERAGVR